VLDEDAELEKHLKFMLGDFAPAFLSLPGTIFLSIPLESLSYKSACDPRHQSSSLLKLSVLTVGRCLINHLFPDLILVTHD